MTLEVQCQLWSHILLFQLWLQFRTKLKCKMWHWCNIIINKSWWKGVIWHPIICVFVCKVVSKIVDNVQFEMNYCNKSTIQYFVGIKISKSLRLVSQTSWPLLLGGPSPFQPFERDRIREVSRCERPTGTIHINYVNNILPLPPCSK